MYYYILRGISMRIEVVDLFCGVGVLNKSWLKVKASFDIDKPASPLRV